MTAGAGGPQNWGLGLFSAAGSGRNTEFGRRVGSVLWASVWLVALGSAVGAAFGGRADPRWVAVPAVLIFIGLYVALIWVAFRREPSPRLVVGVVGTLAGIATFATLRWGEDWVIMWVYVSTSLALTVPIRRGFPAVFGACAAMLVATSIEGVDGDTVGGMVFAVIMAGAITLFVRRLTDTVAELHAAREELARLAVAEERLRIAGDLHDLLGHTLSVIVLKSEVVRRLVHADADAAAVAAGEIEQVGRQALTEVREAVTGYRDRGLSVELDGARSALADANVDAVVTVTGTRLPPDVEALLSRALREGITNVLRHSGARRCEIEIGARAGEAVLTVTDDGSGGTRPSPLAGGGTGLRGLTERIAVAGGRVVAGPLPTGGFRLTIALPLDADAPLGAAR